MFGVTIEPSLLFGSTATVMVRDNAPDMDKFAEQMERDITEDIGFEMAIFVKRSIPHRIAGLFKERTTFKVQR